MKMQSEYYQWRESRPERYTHKQRHEHRRHQQQQQQPHQHQRVQCQQKLSQQQQRIVQNERARLPTASTAPAAPAALAAAAPPLPTTTTTKASIAVAVESRLGDSADEKRVQRRMEDHKNERYQQRSRRERERKHKHEHEREREHKHEHEHGPEHEYGYAYMFEHARSCCRRRQVQASAAAAAAAVAATTAGAGALLINTEPKPERTKAQAVQMAEAMPITVAVDSLQSLQAWQQDDHGNCKQLHEYNNNYNNNNNINNNNNNNNNNYNNNNNKQSSKNNRYNFNKKNINHNCSGSSGSSGSSDRKGDNCDTPDIHEINYNSSEDSHHHHRCRRRHFNDYNNNKHTHNQEPLKDNGQRIDDANVRNSQCEIDSSINNPYTLTTNTRSNQNSNRNRYRNQFENQLEFNQITIATNDSATDPTKSNDTIGGNTNTNTSTIRRAYVRVCASVMYTYAYIVRLLHIICSGAAEDGSDVGGGGGGGAGGRMGSMRISQSQFLRHQQAYQQEQKLSSCAAAAAAATATAARSTQPCWQLWRSSVKYRCKYERRTGASATATTRQLMSFMSTHSIVSIILIQLILVATRSGAIAQQQPQPQPLLQQQQHGELAEGVSAVEAAMKQAATRDSPQMPLPAPAPTTTDTRHSALAPKDADADADAVDQMADGDDDGGGGDAEEKFALLGLTNLTHVKAGGDFSISFHPHSYPLLTAGPSILHLINRERMLKHNANSERSSNNTGGAASTGKGRARATSAQGARGSTTSTRSARQRQQQQQQQQQQRPQQQYAGNSRAANSFVSSCASCKIYEQAKSDSLESIKMHILRRLQLSQLPNVTMPRVVPQYIIEQFYKNFNQTQPYNQRHQHSQQPQQQQQQHQQYQEQQQQHHQRRHHQQQQQQQQQQQRQHQQRHHQRRGSPSRSQRHAPSSRQASDNRRPPSTFTPVAQRQQRRTQLNHGNDYEDDDEYNRATGHSGGMQNDRPHHDSDLDHDHAHDDGAGGGGGGGDVTNANKTNRVYDRQFGSYDDGDSRHSSNNDEHDYEDDDGDGDGEGDGDDHAQAADDVDDADESDADADADIDDDELFDEFGYSHNYDDDNADYGDGDGDDDDADDYIYDDEAFFSRINSVYIFPTISRVRHNRKPDILNFEFIDNHSSISRIMLHVYVRGREWARERDPALLERRHADGKVEKRREVTIAVHRALRRPNAVEYTHTMKLTESRHKIPPGLGQWMQIEIKPASLNLLETTRNSSTIGLVVKGSELWMRPFIVIGDSAQNKPYTVHMEVVTKDKTRRKRSTSLDCQESDHEVRCCRYPLKVNFTHFGWNFVVAPTSFDAYFCNGECKVGYLEQYTHTHITSLTTSATPCCSPTKMSPLSLLYFNLEQHLVFSTIPNMSVEKCSCS